MDTLASMRLWSTRESVDTGEASVLAMLETLLMMGVYVWIGLRFETWWHVWMAATIAPFMLLRTDYSLTKGWNVVERLQDWVGTRASYERRLAVGYGVAGMIAVVWVVVTISQSGVRAILELNTFLQMVGMTLLASAAALFVLLSGLPAIVGRFAGAFIGLFTDPVTTFAAIPGNWWRCIACTDFRQSPELIAHPKNIALAAGRPDVFVEAQASFTLYHAWGFFSSTWRAFRQRDLSFWRRAGVLYMAAFCVGSFVVPALLFRLSIKATALVWLPLLWVLLPPKPVREPWAAHLKLKAAGDIERIVVVYSVLTLFAVALKVWLFVVGNEFARTAGAWHGWLGGRAGELVAAFVRPGEIPLWQLASAANAILALVVFGLVRHWLRRGQVGLVNDERRIGRVLAALYFFRRVLTMYTIGTNLVVYYSLARKLPLPSVGSTLFPW